MYILHKYHTYLLKSYLLQKFTGIISEDHTFIGGSDANHEGLWKWDDGEPFTFTDWAPNEPNGNTEENCLKVEYYAEDDIHVWDDIGCNESMDSDGGYYICEMPQFTY